MTASVLEHHTFAVHVLATTPAGTRSALAVAKRLTAANPARVVLAVPRRTSFATQFDPTGIERTAVIDGHRALAAEVGVHVTVLLCVCRRLDDVVHSLLGRTGFVIVGGRRRGFWPSRNSAWCGGWLAKDIGSCSQERVRGLRARRCGVSALKELFRDSLGRSEALPSIVCGRESHRHGFAIQ